MFNSVSRVIPQSIRFVDGHGKVVGYALSGQLRPEVAKAIDNKAITSGFVGYLLEDKVRTDLYMYGVETPCKMQVKAPDLLYTLTSTKPSVDQVTLSSKNILPGNQWLGSDSWKSEINGMKVYGSHIKSDADMGAISLRIKRGDRIFYRSGPTGGRQILNVSGNVLPPSKLPKSTEWALLDFSSMILPDGDFIIKFSDNGADWGEWSAIALRNNSNDQ